MMIMYCSYLFHYIDDAGYEDILELWKSKFKRTNGSNRMHTVCCRKAMCLVLFVLNVYKFIT